MKYFGRFMLLTLGLGVVAVVLSSFPSHPAAAMGSAPVTVINTPLPVTGNVNAAQSGPWTVGVTGTPTVAVNNTPLTAIPTVVAPAGSAIYQDQCNFGYSGQTASCSFGGFTPATLIITSVSIFSTSPAGDDPMYAVLGSTTLGTNLLYIPLFKQGTSPGPPTFDNWVGSNPQAPLPIPAADSPLNCFVFLASTTNFGGISCAITGYLVNAK
jgi:hypothetical protein